MKRASLLTAISLVLAISACASPRERDPSYLDGYAAFTDRGLVHVVVEIPAGTNDKWEVEQSSGALRWEHENGRPRVVQYLAYPVNYGMIPRTSLPREIGGDGDPLDVLLLGPQIDRGAVVQARPIGVLRLVDDGERDDKILTVPTAGPLSDAVDLESLDARYPGARQILEVWFTSYKGPPGRLVSEGFGDATDAMSIIREASRYYTAHGTSAE
jgi:inorganic pyrophosphatase